ncbi:sarcosine oxidase subunit gamma [Acidiphilium sp. AL]|uniref:sarcosine oxidase subunit gamma n=1 Tax=Acidiphilium sp. AL TaxID=2871704 RepID=UPI0021CB28BA|nr:sarcosine oxidase subunit gamma family protein [Acidiphilium sp. AL]MCU4161104.1 sarcosine oxidase subunit gamma [Acidiphilium sp. AL]
MADVAMTMTPVRRAPLDGLAGDPRARRAVPMARFSLRLPEAAIGAASASLGLDLAGPINNVAEREGCAILRLGPDEWLVLANDADSAAIAAALDRGMPDRRFSLVDIDHRQTGIVLDGADAADMLSAGCPLDLDLAAFPVGMATRTIFAKAEIVLWRTAPTRFHIEVWGSFTSYVWALLKEIGREYPVMENTP